MTPVKLTKKESILLDFAKKDKFLSVSRSTGDNLVNTYWDYCKQIDYPYIKIAPEHQVKTKGLFTLTIDFFSCRWQLTENDLTQVAKRSVYRDTAEVERRKKGKNGSYFVSCFEPTLSSVYLLDEFEVIKTARNFVHWFDKFEKVVNKGDIRPSQDYFPMVEVDEMEGICYLYFHQEQKQFHIYSFNEPRRHGQGWWYLCRDEYSKLAAFLEDAESEKVFKMNSWKAEDFYSAWSVKKFGGDHWDRLYAYSMSDGKKTEKGDKPNMIEIYKDGKALAIRTDISDERDFTRNFAFALQDFMTGTNFQGAHEIETLMKYHADICCKLRGYKADVREQKVLTAGDINPTSQTLVTVAENGSVQAITETQ